MTMPHQDIDGSFVPQASGTVATVELDGEAVLYDDSSGRLHHLNTTASLVWECCDGTVSLDTIAENLAAVFGIDTDVVRSDVLDVVRAFVGQGLLEAAEPGSPAPRPT